MKYLEEIFNQYKNNLKAFMVKLRYDKQLVSELIEATSFLNDYGDISMSERVWYYKEGIKEVKLCPYCQKKKLRFKKLDKGLFSTCGDDTCKKAGMSKGALKERDWKALSSKAKETYKARTGYDNPMNNPECIEKHKKTMLERHGVEYSCQTENAQNKREKSIITKFGSLNVLTPSIENKYGSVSNMRKVLTPQISKTFKENHLRNFIERLNQHDYDYISNNENSFRVRCLVCGNEFDISRNSANYKMLHNLPLCQKCNPKKNTYRSGAEEFILQEISSFYSGIIESNRRIGGKECDIVIPEKKLGIEYNGIYWHSEEYKPKTSHIAKKRTFEKEGYDLMYIWEDDWQNATKKKIILANIKSKLGIYDFIVDSSNTIFKFVRFEEAKKFIEENMISAKDVNIDESYGLYYNDELVELLTIYNEPKRNSKIASIVVKCGYQISNGLKKIIEGMRPLVKYLVIFWETSNDLYPINMTTYQGVSLKKESDIKPKYSLVIEGKREDYKEELKDSGYKKIFDSGKVKYKIFLY